MPATEVWPRLFVGSFNEGDHRDFRGLKLFVLEQRAGLPPPPDMSRGDIIWIPILDWARQSVIQNHLDAVHALIDDALLRGWKCLVFCGQGVERSPLAVVTYIHRKTGQPLSEIYDQLIKNRPQVERRERWLR